MSEKIFSNIILFIIILLIIKNVSPQKDSVLFILQKYLNYIIFKINNVLSTEDFKNFNNTTFAGMYKYDNKTPSFKTSHGVNYVKYFLNLHPDINEKIVYKLYSFINGLASTDTDPFFGTPSDIIENTFNEKEKEKLQTIILNKLNSEKQFSFTEFKFENEPKYYLNINGKELDSFVFNVKSNIGNIRIYIDVNIRNDVYENKEYIVINEMKPITDTNVLFGNQHVIYNDNIKPKIIKKPFNGDQNLIFTNNSIDEYKYDEITVEQLDKISNASVEPVHKIYSKVDDKQINNNFVAHNEYNTDLVKF